MSQILMQIVEKALVIREKKEKYIAREKEALLLCKHPMVVRLYSTFQVISDIWTLQSPDRHPCPLVHHLSVRYYVR